MGGSVVKWIFVLRIKFIGGRQFSASKSPTSCSCKPLAVILASIKVLSKFSEMKKQFCIIYLFVLIYVSTNAQDSIVCSSNKAIVANAKLNILYVGIDNPILISLAENNKFIVKLDEGTIFKKGEFYNVNVSKIGQNHIRLFNSKGKELADFLFRVKNIPTPVALLGGYLRGGEVNKALILSQPILITMLENFDYECFFKVLSYKVAIYHTNNETSDYVITGNRFSQELIDCVRTLKKDDHIYFYEIKAQLINESKQKYYFDIASIDFTIKF